MDLSALPGGETVAAGLRDLAAGAGRVFLTGGATAVLFGWRSTTIDIDEYRYPAIDPPSFRRTLDSHAAPLIVRTTRSGH